MTRGTRAGLRLALQAGTMLAAPLSHGLAAKPKWLSQQAARSRLRGVLTN